MNQKIIDAVKEVHRLLDGKCIFCGSVGLVINGVLKREPKDIDVITEESHYGTEFADIELGRGNGGSSGQFYVGDRKVDCVKGEVLGVTTDFFYMKDYKTEFTERDFYGVRIKVETPIHAIKAKQDYIKTSILSDQKRSKHIEDLGNLSDDLPF